MKFQGWAITYWLGFLILLAVVVFISIAGLDRDSILVAIRSTGRSSLILFSIAFTASSVYHFWKAPFSKWVLRNRRYIGVSFAASHFIHLGLIGTISVVFPEPFLSDQAPSQWTVGGLGYVFIALMAITSLGMVHYDPWRKVLLALHTGTFLGLGHRYYYFTDAVSILPLLICLSGLLMYVYPPLNRWLKSKKDQILRGKLESVASDERRTNGKSSQS